MILDKIEQRYENTVEAYFSLVEEFPETEHLREAERIHANVQKALNGV